MFADGKVDYKIKKPVLFSLLLIVFMALLYIEWKYVIYLSGMYNNDCYFFLIPLCIMLFKLLLNININLKYTKILRNISTIIFPLHASVAQVMEYIIKHFITNYKFNLLI